MPALDPQTELPHPDDTPLANSLESLAQAIAAVVKECKENGTLTLHRITYTLRPNFNLRYSVDPTIINFGIEQVEEEVWDYKNQAEIFESRIRWVREFRTVEALIGQEPRREQLLRNFSLSVARAHLLEASSQVLTGSVKTLLGDLRAGERACKATIWLTGIKLASDHVSISETLQLRRPTRRDLQEKVSDRSAHYAHALQSHVSFSCIAELRLRYLYPVARQGAVDKLTLALRLFRLGAVANSMYAFEEDSFDALANFAISGPGRTGRETYELSSEDALALADFLKEITPLLPTPLDYPECKPDYFSIALHWYGEALLALLPLEGTVASAVACLEALFLEDVQAEMSYRLRMRVAGLMRCFGFPSLEVQSIVKDAYNVRSRYVHGDEQDKEWSTPRLRDLSRSISDYARLALLIFCQFRGKVARQDLLSRVEKSLLDDEERVELLAMCDQIKFCRKTA